MSNQKDTAALQEVIVNRITADGRMRSEVAAVAGVNASQVTHWCDETDTGRQMRLPELARLVRRFGADVVLAPLAALSGCVVVKVGTDAKACAMTLRRCLWSAMGHVEESTADGVWTREEALKALPSMTAAHEEFGRMLEEVRAAAMGGGGK